jgi:hypothetical protein
MFHEQIQTIKPESAEWFDAIEADLKKNHPSVTGIERTLNEFAWEPGKLKKCVVVNLNPAHEKKSSVDLRRMETPFYFLGENYWFYTRLQPPSPLQAQWMKKDLTSKFGEIVSIATQDEHLGTAMHIVVDVKALMKNNTYRAKIDNEVPPKGESLYQSYARHFQNAVHMYMRGNQTEGAERRTRYAAQMMEPLAWPRVVPA